MPSQGALGDALHAVLCGCGHNIRLILAHLRALVAEILGLILCAFADAAAAKDTKDPSSAILRADESFHVR